MKLGQIQADGHDMQKECSIFIYARAMGRQKRSEGPNSDIYHHHHLHTPESWSASSRSLQPCIKIAFIMLLVLMGIFKKN